MKSTNISIRDLVDALAGHRDLNKPVGYARAAQGHFLVAFIATHGETDRDGKPTAPELIGQPIWTEDGDRVKLNWRLSNRQGG